MPTRRKEDPVGNYNFIVELDGITTGRFQSVSGLQAEMKMIEYNDGNDDLIRKIPGRNTYGNITLKRGYIVNHDLWLWWEDVKNGVGERKSLSIVLWDNRDNEVKRWNLMEAWPIKWKLSELNGKSDELVTEEIEFVVEEVRSYSPAVQSFLNSIGVNHGV